MTATPLDTWAGTLVGRVDGALRGLSNKVDAATDGFSWKNAVRAASVSNVTRTSAPASLGGVALALDDRVLLKNQTNATENGIYLFKGPGAALIRAADADTPADLGSATVRVTEGTGAGGQWTQTTKPAEFGPSLGTVAVVWVASGGSSDLTTSTYTLTIEA